MGRVPKYLNGSIEEELKLRQQKKLNETNSIAKKLNKSSNYQILQLCLSDNKYQDNLNLLYRSNHSYDTWRELKTLSTWNPVFGYLKILLKKSDNITESSKTIAVLRNIFNHANSIINPIEDWKPKSRNPDQQLRSLVRHLFTKYPTPTFLEKYFFDVTNELTIKRQAINLYIHLGSGKSMKNFTDFPDGMVIHKKALHHLYTTPDDMELIPAIRRIQVIYLGGNKNIFHSLMRSPVLSERVVDKNVDEFWISVMKFFIDNPMIESDKISEIIDYINNMKFVVVTRVIDGRLIREAEHPNFTMKGRTPLSLINQSDNWHYERDRLNRINNRNNRYGGNSNYKPVDFSWVGSSIANGEFKRNKINTYKIIQLCSYFELRDEGQTMHHCVATYATSCSNGKCSIFSVREYVENIYVGTTATIEVRDYNIVQIRGKYNRTPNDTTISVIKEWAGYEKLKISQYAL